MGRIKDWKRRYGVAGLCCRVVLWLLSKVGLDVRPWVLYRKQLTTEGSRSALPFRELTLADFESQTALNPDWFSGQKMDDMRKAFTVSGNHAYGLFEGDLLVCYGWVSCEQWGLTPRRLPRGGAYFWDAYTHPDYRGRRLHSALAEWRSHAAVQHGCATAYVIVATWNRASRRSWERNGYIRAARYAEWRLGTGSWKTSFKHSQV